MTRKAQAERPAVWFISNRQPWVEGLLSGRFSSKTRSAGVWLPPVGALVLLHASKALWRDWQHLRWAASLDVPNMTRGAVAGIARVAAAGPTHRTMPAKDQQFFVVAGPYWIGSCADVMTVCFADVQRIDPPFACRGAQVPCKKLPQELINAVQSGELTIPGLDLDSLMIRERTIYLEGEQP